MITAGYLFAETEYQICAYAENVYGNVSDGAVKYFATVAMDANYQYTTTISGASAVSLAANTVCDTAAGY